jgi:hypothetical protein
VSDEIESHLRQLLMVLPRVPPISVGHLKRLHKARDYDAMVRFIRSAMSLEIGLSVGWVNAGGPKDNPDAPAWVELPVHLGDMPYHGTAAFKSAKLNLFFRKSFLDRSEYDEVAMAIAHELSHVVLASIRHPLWKEEKAVDLTAMILGFRLIHQSACYKERRCGRTISYRRLGYLSQDEVHLANRILEQNDRPLKTGAPLAPLTAYRALIFVGGAIAFVVTLTVFLPQYRQTQLTLALAAERDRLRIPSAITRSITLIGAQAANGSLQLLYAMDVPKRNIVVPELERWVHETTCTADRKQKISDGASYRFEFRDSAKELIGNFEVRSCP